MQERYEVCTKDHSLVSRGEIVVGLTPAYITVDMMSTPLSYENEMLSKACGVADAGIVA